MLLDTSLSGPARSVMWFCTSSQIPNPANDIDQLMKIPDTQKDAFVVDSLA